MKLDPIPTREELLAQLREAWSIINVLQMNQMDEGGESWPKALFWLERNEKLKNTNPTN